MFSKILSIIIGVGVFCSYYLGYNLFGSVLLIWLFFRASEVHLALLGKGIFTLTNELLPERSCNCRIDVDIDLVNVFKHPAISQLHKVLNKSKLIKAKDPEKWKTQLLENYKKKYGKDSTIEELRFNIKGNLLWKNGEVDFDDRLYHSIVIPYLDVKNAASEPRWITEAIELRLFMVNGLLKLEIGEYPKSLTPHLFKKEGLAVFQTYEHISSFPLMYFSYEHKIPSKFLNLCLYATDSYKQSLVVNNRKDSWKDWKDINKEMKQYSYVCNLSDENIDDMGEWDRIVKNFEEKKAKMLEKERFMDPFGNDDEYYGPSISDYSFNYYGPYFSIFVLNNNGLKTYREKGYADFYQERP